MALNFEQLLQLSIAVARADRTSKVAYSFGNQNYNYDSLQNTFRDEVKAIAGTYQLYREN